MKTKIKMLQWILVLVFAAGALVVSGQQPYPNQGPQTVCYGSTEPYGVIATAGSTYAWSITPIVGGNGTITAGATPNLITVNWTSAGTATLQVIETTAAGCVGDAVTVNITVLPQLLPGSAAADQTICFNTIPALLTATSATGGDGTYTNQWEFSTDGGATWTPIGGANGLTYQPGPLTQTTQYRVQQTSGSSCGTVYTNVVTITVRADLVAGVASANQTICFNTIPAQLSATAPTGGNGAYTYQWEFSTDGGATWTPIGGANGLTYQPGALTQTTWYRVQQTSGAGCGSVNTNNVIITVYANLVAGTASADQTICYNTSPAQLSSTAPTGGDGTYTYQWEFSTDGGATWTPIGGANGLTYQPGALTQTTMYHLVQTSGSSCGTVTTNAVTITVNANLVAGSATANQTICYNTVPAQLNATAPTGGNGSYTYQWEFSIDGGATWTSIGGANGLTYQPGALTQTTMYRVQQVSGAGCGTVYTNSVTITVYANLVAGVASANQTICYNAVPAQLSTTAPTGGNGSYTYQWESSTDGGATWTPIVGANALTYQPGALTQTTLYRVQQVSGGSCGTVYTNSVTITVYANLVAGVAAANQTICYNTIPAQIGSSAPTGGDGSYTYQWEFSTDGGATWTPIGGANSLTYQPGALTQTTMYRLQQVSGSGCGSVYTNNVTITVQANLVAGTASADQTICYNTIPAQLNSTAPTGGNGTYTYQWESSTDGGATWTAVPGANGLAYQPGALTQTTLYRLQQVSGGSCGTVYTNTVTITVRPQVLTSPIYHN